MENNQKRFFRGDIVELEALAPTEDVKINKIRNAVQYAKPYKLVVLRHMENGLYLVAVCKETPEKTQSAIETSQGLLYIKVRAFYPIDGLGIRLCSNWYFKRNKSQVVDEIYELHNALKAKKRTATAERAKKKRQAAQARSQRKREQRRKEREERITLEKEYKPKYEIATLNNDIKLKKEIEGILGYIPNCRGFGTSGKRKNKSMYSSFNPRPSSGGRFTPK